jgi:heme-degrading monooxygenase HmoA
VTGSPESHGAEIMSSVTATVPAYREAELISGYREMNDTDDEPDGLLRSELLRGQNGHWLIQSLWRDREAIMAAREPRKPSALALFDRVGATHSHELLSVEESYDG